MPSILVTYSMTLIYILNIKCASNVQMLKDKFSNKETSDENECTRKNTFRPVNIKNKTKNKYNDYDDVELDPMITDINQIVMFKSKDYERLRTELKKRLMSAYLGKNNIADRFKPKTLEARQFLEVYKHEHERMPTVVEMRQLLDTESTVNAPAPNDVLLQAYFIIIKTKLHEIEQFFIENKMPPPKKK